MSIFEKWTPKACETSVRDAFEREEGDVEMLQENISEYVESWLWEEWWAAGTAAGVDMFERLAQSWDDLDFYGAVHHDYEERGRKGISPRWYGKNYDDGKSRFANGKFLKNIVGCAYEQWFLEKVWALHTAAEQENTWTACENIMEGSGTIETFIDMNGDDVYRGRLEEEQIDGYIIFGRWKNFPMEFDVYSWQAWKITWVLGTWIKECIYKKDVKRD